MSLLELDLHNRRRSQRINRALPVTTLDKSLSASSNLALNLSQTGARLVWSRPVRERFLLELDERTQVVARPVWTRSLGRSSVSGVHFEFRNEQERHQLVRFVQQFALQDDLSRGPSIQR